MIRVEKCDYVGGSRDVSGRVIEVLRDEEGTTTVSHAAGAEHEWLAPPESGTIPATATTPQMTSRRTLGSTASPGSARAAGHRDEHRDAPRDYEFAVASDLDQAGEPFDLDLRIALSR